MYISSLDLICFLTTFYLKVKIDWDSFQMLGGKKKKRKQSEQLVIRSTRNKVELEPFPATHDNITKI